MEHSPIDDINAEATRAQVIEVLRTVFDPEIPVNIYDLGLIYDVRIGGARPHAAEPAAQPDVQASADSLSGNGVAVRPAAGHAAAWDPTSGDPVSPGTVTGDPVPPGPVTGDPVPPGPVTGDPVSPGPVTGDPVTGGPVSGRRAPAGGASAATAPDDPDHDSQARDRATPSGVGAPQGPPGTHVHVLMTLTSPACPVAGSLPPEVEAKIKSIDGVTGATVEIVWDPPWTPERMSEAAKLQLGML